MVLCMKLGAGQVCISVWFLQNSLNLLGTSSWIDFMSPSIRKWWAEQFMLDKYQVWSSSFYNYIQFYYYRGLLSICLPGMIWMRYAYSLVVTHVLWWVIILAISVQWPRGYYSSWCYSSWRMGEQRCAQYIRHVSGILQSYSIHLCAFLATSNLWGSYSTLWRTTKTFCAFSSILCWHSTLWWAPTPLG